MESKKNNSRYSNVPIKENEQVDQNEWREVKGTPFYIVGSEEKGWNIVICGSVCCKELFKTAKAAVDYINRKPWDLILVSNMIYQERINEIKKTLSEE